MNYTMQNKIGKRLNRLTFDRAYCDAVRTVKQRIALFQNSGRVRTSRAFTPPFRGGSSRPKGEKIVSPGMLELRHTIPNARSVERVPTATWVYPKWGKRIC